MVLPLGVWNCMVLVEKPCISCQEKTQSHLFLWYEGSREAWGEVSSEVFLYQIMIIPLLLKLIRKCGAMEESNCREIKKTQLLCGRLWDQGWHNITKLSRPFPLSSFDCYFLNHVWSVSWTRTSETLEIYSNRSCDDFWKATGETFGKGAPNTNTPRRE